MRASLLAGLFAWAGLACPSCARANADPRVRELIELEAARQHLPAAIALAFADDESGLKNAVGDNHRPDPFKRAYGPFQLQARFHLRPGERPHKLLKLGVGIPRGVTAIRRMLELADGDVLTARLMYVCGRKYRIACSMKRQAEITESWTAVWERWRPRALTVSMPDALCGILRATSSRGDSRWPLRRNQPVRSNAKWFPTRMGARPRDVSKTGSS